MTTVADAFASISNEEAGKCPLCGFVWENETTEEGNALADFVMTEIDLLKRSNFRWCDLFGCDDALMATASTPGVACSS